MSLARKPNISSWAGLNHEIELVYKRLTQFHSDITGNGTTVVISGGGGSSSTTTTSSNVKSGTQTVTANTSTWVAFPTTFTNPVTVTLCMVAGTDGSFGLVNTNNLTISSTGFTIPAAELMVSGTIFYVAVSQ